MADQGRWFKLWCASLTDPHLSNLDISDFGRWCKLGAYIKEHGEQGEITLNPPSRTFCFMMQISAFHELHDVLLRLPNITVSNTVSSNDNSIVSLFIKITHWHKYQGDLSTNRVKKHRAKKSFHETANETPKKRGEEKRGEENNNTPISPESFQQLWERYPNKDGRKSAQTHFNASVKTEDDLKNINLALDNYLAHLKTETWKKPKNGSTWLNNWQDWVNVERAKAWNE